jgi:hypothetical protein
MAPFSPATTPSQMAVAVEILSESRVRDQLSAAEELVYVGHREPALVAAGAAVEGTLRLSAGGVAGPGASAGALLEALLALRALDDREYEVLYEALEARDRLMRGYAPEEGAADEERIYEVLAIVIRLLEGCGSAEDRT